MASSLIRKLFLGSLDDLKESAFINLTIIHNFVLTNVFVVVVVDVVGYDGDDGDDDDDDDVYSRLFITMSSSIGKCWSHGIKWRHWTYRVKGTRFEF